ncbi:unnamed protein product [marine sediment metagenome]|uniref:Uncharacterized protein n=1 Tax=marine sediment metagenome TaxID=412755 RepID=X0XDH2_9ZZZZ
MKTTNDILLHVKQNESECLDHRDYGRLLDFFPFEEWKHFGFEQKFKSEYKEDTPKHIPIKLTEKIVLIQLQRDLAFAFEKALAQRCISASFMHEVIQMWMWILDDELANFNNYPMYGLPLFKAVALKYNFPNEIGEDVGDEAKYDSNYSDYIKKHGKEAIE